MGRFALVVDLGGTKIAAARVDSAGKITHHVVVSTPAGGGKAVVAAVIDTLQQLPQQGICALGVDVPGLAYADGSVWAPNLPGWKRMPLSTMLNAHFGLPTLVESDRNAFVTGEAWQGAARNCHDVVFLAIGTGIGAGIISGGRLLRGSGELAGCLGWMATGSHFLPRYKDIGCLESHLAGPGIAREASRIRKTATTTHELIQLARRGDPEAKKSDRANRRISRSRSGEPGQYPESGDDRGRRRRGSGGKFIAGSRAQHNATVGSASRGQAGADCPFSSGCAGGAAGNGKDGL